MSSDGQPSVFLTIDEKDFSYCFTKWNEFLDLKTGLWYNSAWQIRVPSLWRMSRISIGGGRSWPSWVQRPVFHNLEIEGPVFLYSWWFFFGLFDDVRVQSLKGAYVNPLIPYTSQSIRLLVRVYTPEIWHGYQKMAMFQGNDLFQTIILGIQPLVFGGVNLQKLNYLPTTTKNWCRQIAADNPKKNTTRSRRVF